jgi:2-desacetyl-2-hydroxyethyl bacteriochlorophyllide A dehydrogenase
MIAAFCTAAKQFELREIASPSPAAKHAVIRVHRCGICGSDLHFYHGALPPPPVCPGHEISGEVAAVGPGVSGVKPGDRVAVEPLVVCGECAYCKTGDYQLCPAFQVAGNSIPGGFAEYMQMPAYALYRLPAAIDYEVGALIEPLAVTVHAARLAPIRMGDRVLILGAGTIGLLAVASARAAGAGEIWITARHPQQIRAATALGATRVFAGAAGQSELSTAAYEQPIDVVIETVGGTADTLNDAVYFVRRGGTVVVLGIFASSPNLAALVVVVKEVRLIGSMTYGRTGTRADFDIAIDMLARAPEVYRPLVTHRYGISDIGRAFETASDKGSGSIKVAIEP